MESMNIKMNAVDKETFTNGYISVFESLNVELYFLVLKFASIINNCATLVCEDGAHVPITL